MLFRRTIRILNKFIFGTVVCAEVASAFFIGSAVGVNESYANEGFVEYDIVGENDGAFVGSSVSPKKESLNSYHQIIIITIVYNSQNKRRRITKLVS